MIQAAEIILKEGIVLLSKVFKTVYPKVTYHPRHTRRRLLQMPLVAIRIHQEFYLMEKFSGVQCSSIVAFLEKNQKKKANVGVSKPELKELLSLVTNEGDRECVKYTVYKASAITPTQARRLFGMDCMKTRSLKVETAIEEAREIRAAYDDLANCQEQPLLDCYGIAESNIVDQPYNSESSDGECEEFLFPIDTIESLPDEQMLVLLQNCNCNWFEFVEQLEQAEITDALASEKFFFKLPDLHKLSNEDLELVMQSHDAYVAAESDMIKDNRMVRAINGEVVSGSSASDCSDSENVNHDKKSMVLKKRLTIRRRARRLRTKAL